MCSERTVNHRIIPFRQQVSSLRESQDDGFTLTYPRASVPVTLQKVLIQARIIETGTCLCLETHRRDASPVGNAFFTRDLHDEQYSGKKVTRGAVIKDTFLDVVNSFSLCHEGAGEGGGERLCHTKREWTLRLVLDKTLLFGEKGLETVRYVFLGPTLSGLRQDMLLQFDDGGVPSSAPHGGEEVNVHRILFDVFFFFWSVSSLSNTMLRGRKVVGRWAADAMAWSRGVWRGSWLSLVN